MTARRARRAGSRRAAAGPDRPKPGQVERLDRRAGRAAARRGRSSSSTPHRARGRTAPARRPSRVGGVVPDEQTSCPSTSTSRPATSDRRRAAAARRRTAGRPARADRASARTAHGSRRRCESAVGSGCGLACGSRLAGRAAAVFFAALRRSSSPRPSWRGLAPSSRRLAAAFLAARLLRRRLLGRAPSSAAAFLRRRRLRRRRLGASSRRRRGRFLAASTEARSADIRSTTLPALGWASSASTTSRPSTLASITSCSASR